MAATHELASAALLHNIGLCEIDQAILDLHEAYLTPGQQARYRLHPKMALEVLREKRLPLTAVMEQTILHHHENYDGSGFPDGLSKASIPPGAALLSIVGCFDHLRAVRPGMHFTSIKQAWELLMLYHQSTQGFHKFDTELLIKIAPIFKPA